MPNFRYRCVATDGTIQTGTMEIVNEPELEEHLASQGLWLIEAEEEKVEGKGSRAGSGFFVKIKRRDVIDFSIQIATQLNAGVPLMNALEITAEESSNPHFQEIMRTVCQDVESGSTLWEAVDRHPKAFTPEIVSLIRAGESSGNLPEVFGEIRRHLEWVDELMGDIRQASIYPAFILVAIIIFVLVLFTFVVPQFAELLTKLNVELPLITKIVFGFSDFVKATWWIWFAALIIIPTTIGICRRKYRRFAFYYDKLKISLPVFGELNRMISLSRFSHNMSSLFRSGIPILEAIQLCQGLVGNQVLKEALQHVETDMSEGEPMNKVMAQYPVFGSMVVRMVNIGENTGNLDSVLDTVSKYFDETVPRKVKQVFSFMEPAFILFLVSLVAVVALAIFLPIFSLMEAASSQ